MDIEDGHIGRRVREVRSWRRLSLTAAAELAGMSASYLSLIERGLRPVTKRATLESLARALRVSPVELTGKPYTPTDQTSSETHAAIAAITDALAGWWIGEIPDASPRPWADVVADLSRLETLQSDSEYAVSVRLLPGLIHSLLAAVAEPERRRAALRGLIDAYFAVSASAGRFGYASLRALAVERMHQAAGELDDPVVSSAVSLWRAWSLGGTSRARQYQLAVGATETATQPEIRGMSHLTAALAAAARGQGDTAQTHLTEAASLAELFDADVSPWPGNARMRMHFGRTNVGIWGVAIGVELGHGARVAEIASKVRLESINRVRQTAFWIDYGRGLLDERKTWDRGLAALLRAEKLSPEQVRNDAFAREAVTNLLTTSRRAAGGRELRGLASRMMIHPAG